MPAKKLPHGSIILIDDVEKKRHVSPIKHNDLRKMGQLPKRERSEKQKANDARLAELAGKYREERMKSKILFEKMEDIPEDYQPPAGKKLVMIDASIKRARKSQEQKDEEERVKAEKKAMKDQAEREKIDERITAMKAKEKEMLASRKKKEVDTSDFSSTEESEVEEKPKRGRKKVVAISSTEDSETDEDWNTYKAKARTQRLEKKVQAIQQIDQRLNVPKRLSVF